MLNTNRDKKIDLWNKGIYVSCFQLCSTFLPKWKFEALSFQSDCRINLVDRIGENYILKATLDEFDEYRMKKNMSDYMKWKEKVSENNYAFV